MQLAMNAGAIVAADPHKLARRLAVVVALGLLGAGGVAVAICASPGFASPQKVAAQTQSSTTAQGTGPSNQLGWVAAAPGRVEPRTGVVRISASLPGRVTEIAAHANDRVTEGEVLIRLDDKEARARLIAAMAEAAARKRERDAQPGTPGREDVRKAEDAVFTAERNLTNARFELDEVLASDRQAPGRPQALLRARKRLAEAKDQLRLEYAAFATAQAKGNIPAPNRLEASLIAARTEVTMAEEQIDKARIRAPMAGTVLQINAKRGEQVAPSVEVPLVSMGDLTLIRVRAEVDEQDVAKIKVGQRAFVRSDAYPGRDFEGRVSELAPTLGLPRMGSRGARRATDVEVMEVMIDLEDGVPLLPGMRADTFFR